MQAQALGLGFRVWGLYLRRPGHFLVTSGPKRLPTIVLMSISGTLYDKPRTILLVIERLRLGGDNCEYSLEIYLRFSRLLRETSCLLGPSTRFSAPEIRALTRCLLGLGIKIFWF